jgi:DNA/RNA endonuclease YhcR with UshA esterase domain
MFSVTFRSNRHSKMVLKKFVLNPSIEEGNIVEIVGRKSGFSHGCLQS